MVCLANPTLVHGPTRATTGGGSRAGPSTHRRREPRRPRLAGWANLTRIYTRTGDDGTTTLGDLTRTRKTDPRLVAYADVDEATCAVGVALANHASGLGQDVVALLTGVQNDLDKRGEQDEQQEDGQRTAAVAIEAPDHGPSSR